MTLPSCSDAASCLGPATRELLNINFFGLGSEPFAIAGVLLFTASVATTKSDWADGIIFGYLLMILLGVATQLWIFVVVTLMCGLFLVGESAQNKD